jgi:hypothetical protein
MMNMPRQVDDTYVRAEMQQLEAVVKEQVHALAAQAICVTCGSYRRGKMQSGDIDILITDPTSEECSILPGTYGHLCPFKSLTIIYDMIRVTDTTP